MGELKEGDYFRDFTGPLGCPSEFVEEYWIGMYCMAVPVRNYTGKIVAAVSASIPVFRVDDKKKEFVLDELNRTAGQISKELGYLG